MRLVTTSLILIALSTAGLRAQPPAVVPTPWNADPFLIVDHVQTLGAQGDWRQLTELRSYAKAHPGNYILFATKGFLYMLDDPAQVAAAERLDIPNQQLAAKQAQLAARQAPFAARQAELSKQMRTAAGPEAMGRIGAEQGKVGAEQGQIGREQGEIGRQQSVAGLAYYNRVRAMIAQCLANHTCKQIPSTAQPRPSSTQP